MTNEEVKLLFHQSLQPLGFKRKGNKWIMAGQELNKGVYLQKSGYSNSYYINYGFNFRELGFKPGVFQFTLRCTHTLDLEYNTDDVLRQKIAEAPR